jgi:hypothetical protein
MVLLCYTVQYLFYIPQILMVWRGTTSQTGAFDSSDNTHHRRTVNRFRHR